MTDQHLTARALKREVRLNALAQRAALNPLTYRKESQKICRRLFGLDVLREASCVHSFWPIHEKHEVDVRPVILRLHALGISVALPIVHGEKANLSLEHRLFESREQLVSSDLGILEPQGGPKVSTHSIDTVLVPALAVDRSGYRIGYGMGFYDRFLEGLSATLICPIFDRDLHTALPRESHDIPVNMIVTPTRTLDAGQT